jgi:putative nucleotidyltransferase with HDIG domain
MNLLFSKIQQYYYDLMKIVVFALAIIFVAWLSPKKSIFKYEFQIGSPWKHTDLLAPFDFPILKTDDQINEEKKRLLNSFSPFFQYDEEAKKQGLDKLITNFSTLWHSDEKKKNKREKDSIRSLNFIKDLYNYIEEKGVIRIDPIIEGKSPDYKIQLIKDNIVSQARLKDFFTIHSAVKYAENKISEENTTDSLLFLNIISKSLVQNVIYNETKTEAAKKELLSHVSPTYGMMQKGEMIISKGELVTPEKYQILLSLKKMYEEEFGQSKHTTFVLMGIILLITILFLIQYLFIRFFKPAVYDELRYLVLILLSQVSLILISFYVFSNFSEYVYLIPFVILPIVLMAFLDYGTIIVVHLVTIMIIGFFAPNSFEFFYTQFAAGFVAVFSIGNWEHRSQIAKTSLFTFITYIFVYVSMLYSREGNLSSFSTNYLTMIAGNSILLFLAFPIVLVYEKIFDLVTNLTLLELSNTNNKLLRELSMKAPGTFQHSLQVANLASAAVYAINGNTLLAITGAMYHDIGKIKKPMYFTENQSSGYNPHDELPYEESAKIIISHVIDGIEMAHKANLPEQIIDFIRTHHGTRVVGYFYKLEKRNYQGIEIDESKFKYHGPIPFSKETAVVMMADSVEAASRSIKQPNEQKINDLVENIINDLIADNQFANANITFKEITKVKKVLKKKLLDINHVRISYPD